MHGLIVDHVQGMTTAANLHISVCVSDEQTTEEIATPMNREIFKRAPEDAF